MVEGDIGPVAGQALALVENICNLGFVLTYYGCACTKSEIIEGVDT
jgi:hypothetical protein